jgi:hypothetical protein
MDYHVVVHMASGDPVEGVIDELPAPNATFIALKNASQRSSRDLDWLDSRTKLLLISFAYIVNIEISPMRNSDDVVTKHGRT